MFGVDSTGRLDRSGLAGGFIAAILRSSGAVLWPTAVLALCRTHSDGLVRSGYAARSTAASRQRANRPSPGSRSRAIVMPRLVYFGRRVFRGSGARPDPSATSPSLRRPFPIISDLKPIGLLATGACILSLTDRLPGGLDDGSLRPEAHDGSGLCRGQRYDCAAGGVGNSPSSPGLVRRAVPTYGCLPGAHRAARFRPSVPRSRPPPEARGLFLDRRFTGQGTAAFSPEIFGFLAGPTGYGSAFLFVAASSMALAYLLVRYVPETSSSTAIVSQPATG